MEIKNIPNEKTKGNLNKKYISQKIVIDQELQKALNQNKLPNSLRKYTMEPQILYKDFVPILRPIKMNFLPTKFILNEDKTEKLKKNKNNLLSNRSCQNSEEENELNNELELSFSSDISDKSDSSTNDNLNNNLDKNENSIKNLRKKLIKLKKYSFHKDNSKKNMKHKKLSEHFLFIEKKGNEDNQNNEEESYSSDLYEEDNNFINYSINPYKRKELKFRQNKSSKIVINSAKNYNNINNDNNDENYEKRNRIYSFSILDTLKNRLKLK